MCVGGGAGVQVVLTGILLLLRYKNVLQHMKWDADNDLYVVPTTGNALQTYWGYVCILHPYHREPLS